MEKSSVVKLPSMDQIRVYPTNEVLAVAGPIGQNMYITNSVSGSSFLRREKAHKAAWYPSRVLLASDGADFAWRLLRDFCDWYDGEFTQDGEAPQSPKKSISIRLLLLLVPPLVVLDLVLNFVFCILLFPLLFLWCCYPFKTSVLTARRNGPPFSCCLLHEGCDPVLRVWTSLVLLLSTPFIFAGICSPQLLAKRMVRWADGHISGYLYLDRNCLCCCCANATQFEHGIFFRNRAVGDIML